MKRAGNTVHMNSERRLGRMYLDEHRFEEALPLLQSALRTLLGSFPQVRAPALLKCFLDSVQMAKSDFQVTLFKIL